MPALEPVAGVRVVADPAALDRARWSGADVDVIRIAPDEALGIGATDVEVDDMHAIVEPESGFSVALLGPEDASFGGHADWPIPEAGGAVAQGKIAGVAVKVVVGEPTLVVVQTAYADEIERRLGWR